MSAATLGLVLLSAALHATWNLWTKEVRPAARAGAIAWLFTALSAALYAPVALAAAWRGGWHPTPGAWGWIAGSAVLHFVYFLVLLRGYKVGDLSVVYPAARGTGPLWAAAGGIVLFGEALTAPGVAGALLVATGVLLLGLRATPHAAGGARAGLRWGLATGLLIGTYTLWDGWAVKRAGLPPLVYYWAGEMLRVVLYAPLAWRDREGLRRMWHGHRGRVLGIASLSPLSYILILLALRTGAVSHVAPAREISILIGAWLGGQLLAERDRGWRLAAAAAFVAGVVSLALA